jgi:PAS domain S-box-containing protein
VSRDLFPRYFTVTDVDANLVAVSPALSSLIGYRQRELIPGSAFRMVDTSPERRAELTERLVVDGYLHDVAALQHRNGTTIPLEYSVKRWHELYWLVGEPRLEQPAIVPVERRLTYADFASIDRDELLRRTPAPGNGDDPWFTRAQAARYLQVTTRTIDRLRDDGLLPTGGPKGAPRFRRSWLDVLRGDGPLAAAMLVLILFVLAVEGVLVVARARRPATPRDRDVVVWVGGVAFDENAEPVAAPARRRRFPPQQ